MHVNKKIPKKDYHFDMTDLYFFQKQCGFMKWSTGKVERQEANISYLDIELQYKIQKTEVRGGDKFVQIPVKVIENDRSNNPISEKVMKVKIGFSDSYTRPIFGDSFSSSFKHEVYESELLQIQSHQPYTCVGDYIDTEIKLKSDPRYAPELRLQPYYKTFLKESPPYKSSPSEYRDHYFVEFQSPFTGIKYSLSTKFGKLSRVTLKPCENSQNDFIPYVIKLMNLEIDVDYMVASNEA
jgi:hypothetical protein